MSWSSSPALRWLLVAIFAVLAAGLLWLLLGAAQTALALWRELKDLPVWLGLALGGLLTVFLVASLWIGWRLLRPRRVHRKPEAPSRQDIETRLAALPHGTSEAAPLHDELAELDRRRGSGELYVAVFGEISSGKSSLVRALAPEATNAVDVLGGTTTAVAHQHGTLPDGTALVLADVPGSHEVDGAVREALARTEALRAHAVLYVAAGDLTRTQDAELHWLAGFGKPVLLVLNKADQCADDELDALLAALAERYAALVDGLVAVSTGGYEAFERVLPDGRHEQVRRERRPALGELPRRLARLVGLPRAELEAAREQAVLGHLGERLHEVEQAARAGEATRIVDRYTRRAVVGALAAVAPGSDLVIQGALATALVRELAKLHAVPVRQIDLDAFLARAALGVRTASTLLLAIAGNALKAFPGLGTLGGGVLHAIAYGLIFDSLGRAVAATLAEQRRLDQAEASAHLKRLLGEVGQARWRHVAEVALAAVRDGTDARSEIEPRG